MVGAKRQERRGFECPMARLWERIGRLRDRRSPFWDHLTNAKIEVLEAIKSLLEEKIQKIKAQREELTKIEVE
ncbi:MAG: hypothetical protein DRG31_01275 [Deltaproteobacteria bacterium]|nr:MAG: hypothetical protein DRG31_01275 [Deltaproteobacteria bacterium]